MLAMIRSVAFLAPVHVDVMACELLPLLSD
jgi:hypothetical protein